MRQKTLNMQRDQLCLLVAVERVAEMLYVHQHGGPGPIEVRVEHGAIPGWDDVFERQRTASGRVETHRWQVKHQTTQLDPRIVVDLLRELGDPSPLQGTLALSGAR